MMGSPSTAEPGGNPHDKYGSAKQLLNSLKLEGYDAAHILSVLAQQMPGQSQDGEPAWGTANNFKSDASDFPISQTGASPLRSPNSHDSFRSEQQYMHSSDGLAGFDGARSGTTSDGVRRPRGSPVPGGSGPRNGHTLDPSLNHASLAALSHMVSATLQPPSSGTAPVPFGAASPSGPSQVQGSSTFMPFAGAQKPRVPYLPDAPASASAAALLGSLAGANTSASDAGQNASAGAQLTPASLQAILSSGHAQNAAQPQQQSQSQPQPGSWLTAISQRAVSHQQLCKRSAEAVDSSMMISRQSFIEEEDDMKPKRKRVTGLTESERRQRRLESNRVSARRTRAKQGQLFQEQERAISQLRQQLLEHQEGMRSSIADVAHLHSSLCHAQTQLADAQQQLRQRDELLDKLRQVCCPPS